MAGAAASALAACGNYSNEDLLYMSAVPSSSQLAVVLPAAAPTVTQAELAQDTHNGISNVNTMLDNVLGPRRHHPLLRADQPDVRQPHLGPVRRFEQPRLAVGARRRRAADATTFTYHLDVANTTAPDRPGCRF